MAFKKKNSAVDLVPGQRLGKYRLDKKLGSGGYCEVWKARDCVEDIIVALKIPLAGVGGQRDNQQLFHETKLLAKLRHPHIMPVKNADFFEGHAVLATELSFKTLADCSKPMSVRRIVSIISQVLDGLAYAHNHKIVHCDVSPMNIFLFPDGRAALGDFGISLRIKGRMETIDDFGTPGYVSPEQAYGKPTYRSDCFAVGLILYEYLTGTLPKWPFNWPGRGYKKLTERTTLSTVRFLKKALNVDPAKRFANASQMLESLSLAVPKNLRTLVVLRKAYNKKQSWQKIRRGAFIKKYSKVLPVEFRCVDCSEPIAESMAVCPFCGSERNRFDKNTRFDYSCPRCHKGVLAEWKYCPYCYGPGFKNPSDKKTAGIRYHSKCKHCGGGLLRFMRYCPTCHRKVRQKWFVRPFPETCSRCGWAIDTEFWIYCPWCGQCLV
jgi:serine/threonine protein kinase